MKRVSIALVLTLLVGCAPTLAQLPVTATVEERQRADICHAATLKHLDAHPPSVLTWRRPSSAADYLQMIPTPERVAGLGLFLVSAPVWYPIMKSRATQREYDAAFDRCRRHGPEYLGWVRAPTTFTMPEPDAHWAVRP